MIDIPLADLIRGAGDIASTARGLALHRLPAWVRQQYPDPQLMAMEAQPSGIRIVFATTASRIELVTHPNRVVYRGADRPRGRIDVLVDGELVVRDELTGGDHIEVDMQTGASSSHRGGDHTTSAAHLPTTIKRVELWLPHNESLELLSLRADAPVIAVEETARRWVHHGSSISQGSNALAPTEIWPVVAAQQAGLDLRNLGFGGSAIVDPFMSRVIRDAPADVISVALGINVVNLDAMRLRAFVPAVHGFLDTIRDGHPDTPLLLVSPIFCGIHEDTPGPGAIDPASFGTDQIRFTATGRPGDTAAGRLTLRVIREALESVASARSDDPHLRYVDGLELYGEADAEAMPLPDGLHPSTAAHRMIGERFATYLL